MWPFKKKEKKWKPKTDIDYLLLGISHARALRRKYPRPEPPIYTESKIISPNTTSTK